MAPHQGFLIEPRTTWLPPVGLRGVGDALVESFDHYLTRLAHICATDVKSLVRAVNAYSTDVVCDAPISGGLSTRNFPAKFVQAVETLTGQSTLHCGTLSSLRFVLRGSGDTDLDLSRRWCPMCYRDWVPDDSYEPLVWSLPFYSHCSLHGVRLNNRCAHCGAYQSALRPFRLRRCCVRCGKELVDGVQAHPRSSIEKWVDELILEVAKLCGDPQTPVIAAESYKTFLGGLRKTPSRTLSSAANDFRSNLSLKGPSRLTFRSLINLCAVQSIRPSMLLLCPLQASSPTLLDERDIFAELPLPPRKFAVHVERLAIVLSRLLKRRARPLIPMKVALDANYLRAKVLKRLYPSLESEYVALCTVAWEGTPRNRVNRAIRFSLHTFQCRNGPVDYPLLKKLVAQNRVSNSLSRREARMCVLAAARYFTACREVDRNPLSWRDF